MGPGGDMLAKNEKQQSAAVAARKAGKGIWLLIQFYLKNFV